MKQAFFTCGTYGSGEEDFLSLTNLKETIQRHIPAKNQLSSI
jgi:hypothetical protein